MSEGLRRKMHVREIIPRRRCLSTGSWCGTRGYGSAKARDRAIRDMSAAGCVPAINYFICFRDVNAEFALAYGHAEWVAPGHAYVSR